MQLPPAQVPNQDDSRGRGARIRYIEATSGAEFVIRYRCQANFKWKHDINLSVLIDNKIANAKLWRKKDGLHGYITGVHEQIKEKAFLRRYRFSQLDIGKCSYHLALMGSVSAWLLTPMTYTVEAPVPTVDARLKEAVDGLGKIVVKAYWVNDRGRNENSRHNQTYEALDTIPEKALKGRALSHQAGKFSEWVGHFVCFGGQFLDSNANSGSFSLKDREAAMRTNHHNVDYPYGKEPFTTYEFRYRSRDMQRSP